MRALFPILFCVVLTLGAQGVRRHAVLASKVPPAAGGGGGGDTTFITGQTLGTLRNNFDGPVGMKITVGGVNVTVTQLGRWVVMGNSQMHELRVYDASSTLLANVTVNTSGATAGQFLYGTLGSPLTLTAGSSYWILSVETSGGDQWYDLDTDVTSTAVASVVAVGYYVSAVAEAGGAGETFGPVSFKYSSP